MAEKFGAVIGTIGNRRGVFNHQAPSQQMLQSLPRECRASLIRGRGLNILKASDYWIIRVRG
jgi:hypothetical protein